MRLIRHGHESTYAQVNTRCPQRLAAAWLAVGAFLCASVLELAQPSAAEARRRPPRVWSPLQHKHANVISPRHLGRQLSTWYGPGFWGNQTGCGRTLRRRTWGVAHRTLPCGKLVWLRFHGRSIAVPVIDRGPFGGASFDVSERTARYLRFRRHGSGYIRVSVMKRRIPIRHL